MEQNNNDASPVYLVVGCKPWNRRVYEESLSALPGKWNFVGSPQEFTVASVEQLKPKYIFFLHWSWKVPEEIVDNFECICFHMTDVPYGRGGSPLQNLIVRGHRETKLTALKMSGQLDAGPVYLKEPLSLEGSAEEILIRAAELSAAMIQSIIREELQPVAQQGDVVNFKRRGPEQSEIAGMSSVRGLYDFIRMLDAEGYPRAFLRCQGFRLEFSRAALYDGRIVADVRITKEREDSDEDPDCGRSS